MCKSTLICIAITSKCEQLLLMLITWNYYFSARNFSLFISFHRTPTCWILHENTTEEQAREKFMLCCREKHTAFDYLLIFLFGDFSTETCANLSCNLLPYQQHQQHRTVFMSTCVLMLCCAHHNWIYILCICVGWEKFEFECVPHKFQWVVVIDAAFARSVSFRGVEILRKIKP